ncbi:MAG: c-type cytochrome [Rhodobacteraceae bacterium]|nr:c-type cytochrome [Paracoccaceae bacterium]
MKPVHAAMAGAGVAILVGFALWGGWLGRATSRAQMPTIAAETGAATDALVEITVPDGLSGNAALGAPLFAAACATCHGENAVGRDGRGPPLIHRIYEPSHHGDEAFQIAVAQGVRAHHWPFGNMAPVEGLTRGDVSMIVAYIRAVQQANGIR